LPAKKVQIDSQIDNFQIAIDDSKSLYYDLTKDLTDASLKEISITNYMKTT